jgi:hypothetical protein
MPARRLRAEHDRTGAIESDPVERVFTNVDAIAASALVAIGVVFAGRRLMTTGIDVAELMQVPVDELRSFVNSGRVVDVASSEAVAPLVRAESGLCPTDATHPPLRDLSLVGAALFLLPTPHRAYMYHVDGHVRSLIMSDQNIELPFRNDAMVGGRPAAVREFGGSAHILWRDGKLCYSVVSDQLAARLVQVASIAMATGYMG